jgi:phosphate acetyltransferase
VITPGDRADIILGALQANESANYLYFRYSLTGNIVPDDSILKLIEGFVLFLLFLSKAVPIVLPIKWEI